MKIFEQYIPPPPLSSYIDCFIYYQGYNPEHSIERVVPDGSVHLIFELDGMPRTVYDNDSLKEQQTFDKSWISGIHRKYISISAHPDSEMFVVRFKPWGAYPFLHRRVDALNDLVLSTKDVIGDQLLSLRQDLLDGNNPADKFEVITEWLLGRYRKEYTPETFVREVVQKMVADPLFLHTNLQEMIRGMGISQKHLIQLFKKYCGVTPKFFQRIIRFNEIIPKVQNQKKISWAQISYECGFFDQAHFIKEFKHFSGFNPKEFLDAPLTDERHNFFPVG